MNKKLVCRLLGAILLVEAAAMVPSIIISFLYRDGDHMPLIISALATALVGAPMMLLSKKNSGKMRAKEGFFIVGFAWILLAMFGALPLVLSGVVPTYVDGVFEAISGFTTTGATVVTDFSNLPHGVAFWRSFTHWIGGMGVLLFTLALLPKLTGQTSHLVKAESPGPTLSKIVPRMTDSAKILYIIYFALTLIEFILLMFAGLSPYDAAIHAMGTAGTGGFSNYGASVGAFNSAAVDAIITVFMILFGVNFALYYKVLIGGWREVFKSEELRCYLSIITIVIVTITLMILPLYGNILTALRYSSFQVASIMSTTGYATADFNLWPQCARHLIVFIMFLGSCVGSTAGGMKIMRVGILVKMAKREIGRSFQPRKVQRICWEGEGLDKSFQIHTTMYAFIYFATIILGMFLLSLDGRYGLEENFTAALTCVSNVGPGLGAIGPSGNFAEYSLFSKIVMSGLMLCGRLELYPMLALAHKQLYLK